MTSVEINSDVEREKIAIELLINIDKKIDLAQTALNHGATIAAMDIIQMARTEIKTFLEKA